MNKQMFLGLMLALMVGCTRSAQQQQPVHYPTQTLETSSVELASRYSASIQGKQDIAILPQVGGFLTELCVTEGEIVKKGQPLFVIDSVNFAAALRLARANEQAAKALVATNQLTYDSKKQLREQEVVSEYELQVAYNALLTAKANLAQAEAAVVNAKQNLSYTVVKSPCNGVVGRLPFRVGALVSPQMPEPLTTVSDNSEMYVYFSMTELQAMSLIHTYGSSAQAIAHMPDVQLALADGRIYSHTGRVESISGVIDPRTGAVSVRAKFPNPDRVLLSGGSGNVVIPDHRDGVIVIGQAATFEIQDKVYVWCVKEGKTTAVIITVTPLTDGKHYIVESGLKEGDVIVSEGAAFVREGQIIE